MFLVRVLSVCWLVCCLAGSVAAETLTVAAGAGYKRPMSEINALFATRSGNKVEEIYGNMGQVLSQAKAGAPVDVIVGDKGVLEDFGLPFAGFVDIGHGRLVIAHAKGVTLNAAQDLASPAIARIALPDPQKAIYGKAGTAFLAHSGLQQAVKDKLLVVATVPQVTTYLATGEVQAGFINLTDALGAKEKLGGWLLPPEDSYPAILISAGLLAGKETRPVVRDYKAFLASPAARGILEKYGL